MDSLKWPPRSSLPQSHPNQVGAGAGAGARSEVKHREAKLISLVCRKEAHTRSALADRLIGLACSLSCGQTSDAHSSIDHLRSLPPGNSEFLFSVGSTNDNCRSAGTRSRSSGRIPGQRQEFGCNRAPT